ncbi:ABC transporter ATP-binding protein [Thermococcus gammatolerans]|uniref:ABC-type transport system, ATPase component, putative multidrug transporter n=1 Tax=Thermococcus gammatolerans (strain DSM 15229 / JCM 11827 / EJ3) TaxID=593117 RepID=C5A7E6_THEGJ|nr:ABC transporter ATP-binding protein [Thermococcus gammatolerans]ACS34158.1 ABC-type transport system, ATPase component, putative multidrug transporter [Thermococcus gammatolerans EJ3]
MIKIENLVKTYRDVKALDGLNLEVKKGQIYGFLGPNGAGKSTTILSVLGLIYPQKGKIELFGQEIFRDGKYNEKRLVEAKKKIGYMPEHATLWEFLTPMQTLDIIGESFGMSKEERARRSRELLELLNLWEVRNKKVGKFSKGMKQRLLLAQALINDPELLILDEPMTGLDPKGIAEFKDIIRRQKKEGKTVFFSSHILAHVEEVCDTVGVIVRGKLRVEDSIDNIKMSFLRKGGYLILLETDRPVEFKDVDWEIERVSPTKYKIKAPEDVRAQINDIVWSQGAKILQLMVRVPSLEEIFLKMVEEEG